MIAYDPAEWTDLFVATAGAAAALAGLVFVAVSINLKQIVAERGLAERALQTMLMLAIIVVISILALIPGQDNIALGIELLAVTLGYSVGMVLTARASIPSDLPRGERVGRLILIAIGTVPLLVGALSLLAECGGGLYWIAAGVIGAIAGGVANAWVLLVEIQR